MENIPELDLNRSSIAKHIGKLAEMNGLFLSHYEYRQQFDAPDIWKNSNRLDLEFDVGWENGSLKEFKYQSFRNDIRIGSFNPAHQNKWTSHELCHGLVGFAWNKNWQFFDHAIAARLSELLPVVVYYFYDEADCQRCEKHAFPNIFYGYCAECELKSHLGPKENAEQRSFWMKKGKQFFDNEMRSIKASLEQRRCFYHIDHHLNLMSDGLAYASQQYKRISSPEYIDFIERFYTDKDYFSTIEDLMRHVEQVHDDLLMERLVDYKFGDPNSHKIKDLAWRFYELSADCSDELKESILNLIDEVTTNFDKDDFDYALNSYKNLLEEWELPEIDDIYAFGYHIDNKVGYSTKLIREGLESAFVDNIEVIESKVIDDFMEKDRRKRGLLAQRFTRYLNEINHKYSKLFSFLKSLHFPEHADEIIVSFQEQIAESYIKVDQELFEFNSDELQKLGFDVETNSKNIILFAYRESVKEMSIVEIPPDFREWYCNLPNEFLYRDYLEDEDFLQTAINLSLIKGQRW